jgi:hypothetical protein
VNEELLREEVCSTACLVHRFSKSRWVLVQLTTENRIVMHFAAGSDLQVCLDLNRLWPSNLLDICTIVSRFLCYGATPLPVNDWSDVTEGPLLPSCVRARVYVLPAENTELSKVFANLTSADKLQALGIEQWGLSQTTLEEAFIRIVNSHS